MENTTNKGGGACYDLEEIRKIKQVCDAHQLGLHLDGARLFNALVARKENPKDFGELFDTISICLSKGLGCPVGSVLIGDEKFMKKALRIRKVFGGGMRQIGFLAAAGIYALDHHVERLAEDHKRAKEIAEVLQQQKYIQKVEPIETNVVIFYLLETTEEKKFLAELLSKGIKISTMGEGKLRIVTHLDYNQNQHQQFLSILEKMRL